MDQYHSSDDDSRSDADESESDEESMERDLCGRRAQDIAPKRGFHYDIETESGACGGCFDEVWPDADILTICCVDWDEMQCERCEALISSVGAQRGFKHSCVAGKSVCGRCMGPKEEGQEDDVDDDE